MDIGRIPFTVIGTSCLTLLGLSVGHAAPVSSSVQQPIYVEPLKATLARDSASADGGASRRTEKVEKNASALTEALIRELNARGVTTYPLSEQGPTPRAGWVIRGVFTEHLPRGLLFSQLRSLGSSTPNTEVEISISDLGADSDKSAKLISAAASLSGQGSAFLPQPL